MKCSRKIMKMSKALRTISDKTRIAVLKVLLEKERHVKEIVKIIHVEPTLLSHHLSVLRKNGIISSIRDGKKIVYSINNKVKLIGAVKGVKLGHCDLIFND